MPRLFCDGNVTREMYDQEYVAQLIVEVAKDIENAIPRSYQKMVDKEKIRFTRTKEYQYNTKRNQRNQGKDLGLDSQKRQLGYWVPSNSVNSVGSSHITYSANHGRHSIDLDAPIPGFAPSQTENEYRNDILTQLAQETIDDLLSQLIINQVIFPKSLKTIREKVEGSYETIIDSLVRSSFKISVIDEYVYHSGVKKTQRKDEYYHNMPYSP